MRRFGEQFLGAVALLMVVGFCGALIAGSFTITTTAAQDKKIHKMLTMENDRRTSLGQSELTTTEFFQAKLVKLFKRDWRRTRKRLLRNMSASQLDDIVNP